MQINCIHLSFIFYIFVNFFLGYILMIFVLISQLFEYRKMFFIYGSVFITSL